MNNKRIFSWLLALFGEAIIITAFILFRGNTPNNILILNIAVSSIVYALFFINYSVPWIDLKDKSQKQIGVLGISWFATWIYAIFAIGTIVTAYFVPLLTFTVQLIIHCTLLFFLLMFMLLSRYSAGKVAEVYKEETKNRNGINEMKTAMRQLKDKMNDLSELPEMFIQRINTLEDNLRFISPSGNSEAHDFENSFIETVSKIKIAIPNYSLNEEQIENNVKKLERIYQNRKTIYEN